MTDINKKDTFDKYELDKMCQLLQCNISDIDKIIDNADKIYEECESVYDIVLTILQQGHNVREATLIGMLCGQNFGFNQAKEQIEDDIKQKLFDAFNNSRG